MTDYYHIQNKMRKYLYALMPAIILGTGIGAAPVYSQGLLKGKELLQYYLDQKNMEYKCPDNWVENFEQGSFSPSKKTAIYTIFRIEPPKKDAIIMFYFLPFMSIQDSMNIAPLVRRLNPKGMPARNKQYLTHAKNQADTLEGKKITFYPSKYARKVFGADHAGTYHLWQTNTYRNKFDRCEVVYLFKNDVGLLELYYFYNSDTQNIDKYIKKTAGMVRFKKE